MTATTQWLELYKTPDPGIITKLSPQDFKNFIAYVFERAGYTVAPYDLDGADFELREGRHIAGYVAATVGVHQVGSKPVLALSGVPSDSRTEKFYISAEDFSSQAAPAIEKAKHIFLMDIVKLQRYINYVRGTRHPKSRDTPLSPSKLFGQEPQKRPTTRTKVMVLANNKGGVCKTTSAFAIGLILATEMNKKVLFVDLDDQANLTQSAIRVKKSVTGSMVFPSPNISDHFADFSTYPLGTLIQPTNFKNAWIIPSAPELRMTLSTTVDWTETEQRFTTFLHHESVVIPNNGGDFDWM